MPGRRVVVFYVWMPGRGEETRAFADAYNAHAAGVEHELVVMVKSSRLPGRRERLPDATWVAVGSEGWDIGPFTRLVRERADEIDQAVLLGLYARPLVDGWLRKLVAAGPLAASTGSHEALPHLRTSCLSVTPELLARMPASRYIDKAECWAFEHGPRSLYRRAVLEAGVPGVVVDREGRTYVQAEWRDSLTFRWGEQENLLVADNHTDTYAKADPEGRGRLQVRSWGQRQPQTAPVLRRREKAPITVLTVTIPGREQLLTRNLASVYEQTVPVARHLVCAHIANGSAMAQYTAAKNDLLRSVETEWVAVLNDDDYWLPRHVETVLPALKSRADVIYTYDRGGTRPRIDVTRWSIDQLKRQMDRGNIIDGNALIRTSALRSVGGFPTEWIGGSPLEGGHFQDGEDVRWEDQALWIRLLRRNARFLCVPEVTWHYSVVTPGRMGGRT